MSSDIEKAREIGEATWLEGHASPQGHARAAHAGILAGRRMGLEEAAAEMQSRIEGYRLNVRDPDYTPQQRKAMYDEAIYAERAIRSLMQKEEQG